MDIKMTCDCANNPYLMELHWEHMKATAWCWHFNVLLKEQYQKSLIETNPVDNS